MAITQYCSICQENTWFSASGQCLNCHERQKKLYLEKQYQEWKKNKSVEEQIKDLYFMINYSNNKDVLFG